MDTNYQKELMSFLENEGMAPVTVPKRNYWFYELRVAIILKNFSLMAMSL